MNEPLFIARELLSPRNTPVVAVFVLLCSIVVFTLVAKHHRLQLFGRLLCVRKWILITGITLSSALLLYFVLIRVIPVDLPVGDRCLVTIKDFHNDQSWSISDPAIVCLIRRYFRSVHVRPGAYKMLLQYQLTFESNAGQTYDYRIAGGTITNREAAIYIPFDEGISRIIAATSPQPTPTDPQTLQALTKTDAGEDKKPNMGQQKP